MAQTPIYDELHRTYRAGPQTLTGQVRAIAPDLRAWATLAALALAVCGLVFVSVRNPGMALVTLLLFTVAAWAVERIMSTARGQ